MRDAHSKVLLTALVVLALLLGSKPARADGGKEGAAPQAREDSATRAPHHAEDAEDDEDEDEDEKEAGSGAAAAPSGSPPQQIQGPGDEAAPPAEPPSSAQEEFGSRNQYIHYNRQWTLDCAKLACKSVLPGATAFRLAQGTFPYAIGTDAAGATVGWVVISTDVTTVNGYSGKPIVTLVGLDTKGVIAGTDLLHYDEPIFLAGIPPKRLYDLVAWYVGKPAAAKIQVGAETKDGVYGVDVISGATVTTIAENNTILESARRLGRVVGVVAAETAVAGHFVIEDEPWSWHELQEDHVLGHLTVTNAEMGLPASDEPFVDITFAIADPPQVGQTLLGAPQYDYYAKHLVPGQHLLVVMNNGSQSFVGSAYVRGGMLDRVHLAQGLSTVDFWSADYENLSGLLPATVPPFREAALFIVPKDKLDVGRPFDFVFLGNYFDDVGAKRTYRTFRVSFQVPPAEYVSAEPASQATESIWRIAWGISPWKTWATVAYLVAVAGLFAGRRWLTRSMKWIRRIHLFVLVLSFGVLGLWFADQPSVTQILTLSGTSRVGWNWGLFLSDPLLFVTWIFIAITTVIWGRGVFCGWVCPYGAASELLNRVGRRLKLRQFEFSDRTHRLARLFRYVVLVVLIAVYLYSPAVGEMLTDVEPFKLTFLVDPWSRPWLSIVWWILLFVVALFVFRPFCRYLCPLGISLAVLSSLRLSGPYRRRFCASCKICTRGCEPRAIRENGTIDPRECLSCMECETNFQDKAVCPPLIGLERLTQKKPPPPDAAERLEKLRHEIERV